MGPRVKLDELKRAEVWTGMWLEARGGISSLQGLAADKLRAMKWLIERL